MTDLTATKKQVQRALVDKGFDLGKSGPGADGVDGVDGARTWSAIASALAPGNPSNMGNAVSPIAMISAELLRLAAPHRPLAELEPWVAPIKAACVRFEINTIRRVAAFLTTLGHEGGFKVGARENMNFSAKRMSEVWPGRFGVNGKKGAPNGLAHSLDRKPEDIANHVYANRMGNGQPESGDGWRFRGNGPIQLTGRANHEAFAKAMGMSLIAVMSYIATIEGGVMSAAWFWEENDVNRLADTPGVADETKRINGGTVGLTERKAIFDALVKRMLEKEAGR